MPAKAAECKYKTQTKTLRQPTLARTIASWVLHQAWDEADGRTLYTCVAQLRSEIPSPSAFTCRPILLPALPCLAAKRLELRRLSRSGHTTRDNASIGLPCATES